MPVVSSRQLTFSGPILDLICSEVNEQDTQVEKRSSLIVLFVLIVPFNNKSERFSAHDE